MFGAAVTRAFSPPLYFEALCSPDFTKLKTQLDGVWGRLADQFTTNLNLSETLTRSMQRPCLPSPCKCCTACSVSRYN